MMRSTIKKVLLATALILSSLVGAQAQEHDHEGEAHAKQEGEAHATNKKFDVGSMIMHHIKDDHGWEFAHGVTLPLPVILYSKDRGLEVFSSANLAHEATYNGYKNVHGKIHRVNEAGEVDHEAKVYNFSITKNVASLLLSAVIMLLVFSAVSRGYAKNKGKAPSGIQSFLEPIILFVRDEIAKPSIGPKYTKYLPYLLTLFFFILVNNLLGLLPGAANLTGNITVTLVLAVITFLIVTFSGNKHYWMHILKPTGVPVALLPIMIPVEIVGVFMKPLSLMIRLFANITAGHIIILSLLGLIFMANNMGGMGTSVAISPVVLFFTLFLNLIELLVAFLQAFIFTLLTAMYIGSAVEDHHEADHGIGFEGTTSELG
ncbi:F0F1 ATP synthase subunit A [Spirosoma radiotolerans]|uniref:ATP synthase subunit a n=1 Tax=Spirosoma radiotolerans TaxID=1379870 RepID=A0A0E3VAS7_9BACT|nr:F0F1 ATP synthase subunit A [Spirosoma radiotolerans]AKD58596.1 ATP synthase F0 subunit A [Spirosoma radiotolerans]